MWQVIDSPAVIPIYHNSKSATSHTPCCQTNMLKQLATIFQDWMILKKCVCFTFIFYIFDCWLCTWGRYGILVWNIGGDRRHTPTIVPTTSHPHQPNTLPSHHQKYIWRNIKWCPIFIALLLKKKDFLFSKPLRPKMAFLYPGRMSWPMKEWGLFSDYQPSHSPVTSDSLHLSGLGGQTDGLSLISPESVVSTARRDTLKINSQSKRWTL